MPKLIEIQSQMIQRQLEAAQIREIGRKGNSRRDSERKAILGAMSELERLRVAYHQALVDQAHSVRVKQIVEDFARLEILLGSIQGQPLTELQQETVRNRIKTWHYESRRWIQDLPLQPCLRKLPALGGASSADRKARVEELWLQAGGAWFAPAPMAPRDRMAETPRRFLLREQPRPIVLEPMGPGENPEPWEAPSRWVCRPEPLLKLLALAREALEVEIGGPNLGGHASFEERRRRSSLKDSFAFTCVRIYERAVGPKTARQGDALRRDLNETSFDHFVALVHRWVAGPDAPPGWEPGLQPIRKAIATQRAWQKLLKAAKCPDEDAFNALPLEVQQAAVRKLPEKVRLRLTPPAPPLI
jgi:hypothetical protein